MHKLIKVVLFIGVTVFLSGCLETDQEFFVNPNGSGKVIHKAVMQSIDMGFGPERTPEEKMTDIVKGELEKSVGVDAWKDVSYKRREDGKIVFKGTAYFKDVTKLKIHNNGFSSDMMKISFFKNAAGELVLKLGDTEKNKKEEQKDSGEDWANLSDEELTAKIQEERAKYEQMRPMFSGFISTLRNKMVFHLPGELKAATNFTEKEGTLEIVFEAQQMLDIMDKMMTDEDWIKEQIRSGGNLMQKGPQMGNKMNEEIFGENAPIQAIVVGSLEPLFDYDKEVKAAKINKPDVFEQLGVVEIVPVEAVSVETKGGMGLKNIRVAGFEMRRICDRANDICPGNYDRGYKLYLVAQLPEKAIKVSGGKIIKAIADNGDNLLPKDDWSRKISFPKLGKDKKTVLFEIALALPGKNAKSFRNISGILEYQVAGGTKEVDLGISDFVERARGSEYGAVIKSIKESQWQKGQEVLSLKLNISYDKVKSMSFYDAAGQKIDIDRSGYSSMGNVTTFEYQMGKGKLPPKGRIVAEVFTGLKKYEIPFKLKNISLLGLPLKKDTSKKVEGRTDKKEISKAGKNKTSRTSLSKDEVISIARRHAASEEIDVNDYAKSSAKFSITERTWRVLFEMDPMPRGGWFDVIVDDETGNVLEMQRGR